MAKRKKHKVLTEGFLFGLIISGVANLITYQEIGMYNVLVGGKIKAIQRGVRALR